VQFISRPESSYYRFYYLIDTRGEGEKRKVNHHKYPPPRKKEEKGKRRSPVETTFLSANTGAPQERGETFVID